MAGRCERLCYLNRQVAVLGDFSHRANAPDAVLLVLIAQHAVAHTQLTLLHGIGEQVVLVQLDVIHLVHSVDLLDLLHYEITCKAQGVESNDLRVWMSGYVKEGGVHVGENGCTHSAHAHRRREKSSARMSSMLPLAHQGSHLATAQGTAAGP